MCACACLYVYKIIKIIFFIVCVCVCVCLSQTHFILLQQQQQQQQQFLYLYFGKGTKRNEKEDTNGYGHTKRKAPLLARSVKLSLFGLGQYQGWRQPGNSECCNLFAIYFLFLLFVILLFARMYANACRERKEKRGVGRASSFYYFSHSKIKKAFFIYKVV